MFLVRQFVFLAQSVSEVRWVAYISIEIKLTIEQRVFIVETYAREKNLENVYSKIS
jgi:hypothetical protein